MNRLALPVALAPALALLAGCARDDTDYPSLATRAAEGRGFAEPVVTPPVASANDPALDTGLRELGETIEMTRRSFDGDADRAERASRVAGARVTGSEAWVAAQTALSRLDEWRARTSALAATLDDLARERTERVGTPYPPLETLRERVAAMLDQQAARAAAIE